jgi:hypothetical protein
MRQREVHQKIRCNTISVCDSSHTHQADIRASIRPSKLHTLNCTKMPLIRPSTAAVRSLRRCYSTSPTAPKMSPFAPRHLLSIADLTPGELTTLVRNAGAHKAAIKGATGEIPHSLRGALAGKTVAMTFNKRSTRTRVSTEGAIAAMGGTPMFLGKDDIQLGVRHRYSNMIY